MTNLSVEALYPVKLVGKSGGEGGNGRFLANANKRSLVYNIAKNIQHSFVYERSLLAKLTREL
jgi:hypothetical protein